MEAPTAASDTPPIGRPRREPPRIAAPPVEAGRDLETRVRGDALLRLLERGFLLLDRLLGRLVPDSLNPLRHSGPIAVTSLLVAVATGVPLLVWYRPSVHMAWPSVSAMAAHPWTAELLRSLHRYGSDLAMGFTFIHALRLLVERRFSGARWLAWVTGVLVVAVLWFVGWTGYWLVWDARAQAIALGTARVLDVMPIFADPLGRSFLTDRSLNSLLFFVIFFLHMLVPLAAGILLWLHLVRLARPYWVTRRELTLWTLGGLIALSVLWPADTAAPARMTAFPTPFPIDAWYLAPLALTDRLGGGTLWLLFIAGGLLPGIVPWAMARKARPAAAVDPTRCFACNQCATDCPFDAIAMVPRTAGSTKYPVQARVDSHRCVACGICTASCDSVATDLPWLGTMSERRRIESWLRETPPGEALPIVVFACAHAAGGDLPVETASGRSARLPGVRLLQVPCAGWVHTMTVERALREGAIAVVISACPSAQCVFREGPTLLRERLDGARKPSLRSDKVPRAGVHVLSLERTHEGALRRAVDALRAGRTLPRERRAPALAVVGAVSLGLAVAWGIGAMSVIPYSAPRPAGSELVVTFKHPGRVSEHWRTISPEEKAKLPVQMRRDRVYDRKRASVRMRVDVDGRAIFVRAYPPKGVWHDGNSIAVETILVTPGSHLVEVSIGDSSDPDEWSHRTRQQLTFSREARRVVTFDRIEGFTVQ